MPVYDKTLDNVVGIVHVKDLLCALFDGKEINIAEIMNSAVLFVPPAIRALDLLREMQAKRAQMAVVIDEFGGTDGLITLEDLLEEIVGEIEDEHDALDEALRLKQINSDLIEADARVYIDDLEDMTGPFLTPADKEAEIDTVGGLVFHHAGAGSEFLHHDGPVDGSVAGHSVEVSVAIVVVDVAGDDVGQQFFQSGRLLDQIAPPCQIHLRSAVIFGLAVGGRRHIVGVSCVETASDEG
jgi:CBS domain containing-hemolysin-like protein